MREFRAAALPGFWATGVMAAFHFVGEKMNLAP